VTRIAEPKLTKPFRRLKGDPTRRALIAAMQASPDPDIDLAPERGPMPVRDVSDYQAGRVPALNPRADPLPD
jgi:hypothetical protein